MTFWTWKKGSGNVFPPQEAPELSAMDRLLQGATDRDTFLLLYAKLLGERLPGVTMTFTDATALQLTNPQGRGATAYLENLWSVYSAGTEGRQELLERYARMSDVMFAEKAPLQKQNLIPLIKDLTYVQQFQQAAKIVTEHLVADLWVVYAEDLPDRVQTVNTGDLQRAGIAREEVRDLAVTNLLRLLPEVQRHGSGPWFMVTAGDQTASLLLIASVWGQLAATVEGDLVAVVPARDVLLFTGSESREGLAGVRQQASQVAAGGDHLISNTLLVRMGDVWKLFDPN